MVAYRIWRRFPAAHKWDDDLVCRGDLPGLSIPERPDIQKIILAERSPMTAKMKSKPYRKENTRPDWEIVKVKVMKWCLRVKLAQNWIRFGDLLRSTDNRPIVEESRKDDFWGAKRQKDVAHW